LRREELYAFDEDKGSILADTKIDDHGSDNDRANLHSQAGKTICRLPGLQRMEFKAADDLTKGLGNCFAAALKPSLAMDSANGIG